MDCLKYVYVSVHPYRYTDIHMYYIECRKRLKWKKIMFRKQMMEPKEINPLGAGKGSKKRSTKIITKVSKSSKVGLRI